MANRRTAVGLAALLLLLPLAADAQTVPSTFYGIDLAPNASMATCRAGHMCLRLKAGLIEQSYDGGTYIRLGLPTLAGVSGAVLMEEPIGTLKFRQLTLDDITAAFTVTLAGPTSPVEVGSSVVNPQFTDTHNQTPSSATLQDYLDTQAISPATATALGYAGAANTFGARTYNYCSSLNCTRTWTYSAIANSVTKTATKTITWEPLVYYGMVVPATYNAAFITGLSSSSLSAVTGITISYAAGGGTKEACYALPSSYAAPVSFTDTGTGFGVSYSKVASAVSVTNSFSVAINYDVYCSDFLLNSAFTGRWQ